MKFSRNRIRLIGALIAISSATCISSCRESSYAVSQWTLSEYNQRYQKIQSIDAFSDNIYAWGTFAGSPHTFAVFEKRLNEITKSRYKQLEKDVFIVYAASGNNLKTFIRKYNEMKRYPNKINNDDIFSMEEMNACLYAASPHSLKTYLKRYKEISNYQTSLSRLTVYDYGIYAASNVNLKTYLRKYKEICKFDEKSQESKTNEVCDPPFNCQDNDSLNIDSPSQISEDDVNTTDEALYDK